MKESALASALPIDPAQARRQQRRFTFPLLSTSNPADNHAFQPQIVQPSHVYNSTCSQTRWSWGSEAETPTTARRRVYGQSAIIESTSRFSTYSTTSLESYCTASSYLGSYRTAPSVHSKEDTEKQWPAVFRTFRKLLEKGGLSSLVEEGANDEFDWCGRGMHVEFDRNEMVPLTFCETVGHGSTATVDIVQCRRIKLARKTTILKRRISEKDLLREVQALQKLRHPHVVQLIGTYRKGQTFAALLYPVADMDLASYLEEARYMATEEIDWPGAPIRERTYEDVLSKGSLCLISALRYVHESGVKHMDIKPANILLKRYDTMNAYINEMAYRMYICDFGLAQPFNLEDQSQTEEYPGKTPTYASPEVAAGEIHGRASDIFSMGCVLTEMMTVYSGMTIESLRLHRRGKPFHEALDSIRSFVTILDDMMIGKDIILEMLQEDPNDRPSLIDRQGSGSRIEQECLHSHDPPDLFEADENANPANA